MKVCLEDFFKRKNYRIFEERQPTSILSSMMPDLKQKAHYIYHVGGNLQEPESTAPTRSAFFRIGNRHISGRGAVPGDIAWWLKTVPALEMASLDCTRSDLAARNRSS